MIRFPLRGDDGKRTDINLFSEVILITITGKQRNAAVSGQTRGVYPLAPDFPRDRGTCIFPLVQGTICLHR